MPKIIKKKIDAPEDIETAEEVKTLIVSLKKQASIKSRDYLISIAVIVAIAIAIGGVAYYKKHMASSAMAHEYAGYKLYYGLYDKQGAIRVQRLTEALGEFQKAYDTKPAASSLYYIGSTYFGMGRYADAIASFESLIGKFPADRQFVPLARYRIAASKQRMGKDEEALKQLETMFTESVSLRDVALAESAQLLVKLGRPKEARAKYQEIVQQFPGSAYAEQARAFMLKYDSLTGAPSTGAPAAGQPKK